jgi:type II secretory pathway component PulC
MSQPTQAEQWHLDKRVPLALITTSLLQIVSIVWIASQMNADIQTNKENIQRLDNSVNTLQREANTQAVQMGRIEEGISGIRRDIASMLEVIKDQQNQLRGTR